MALDILKNNGKKGAKAFASVKKYTYMAIDKETNLPMLDKDGKIIVSNATEDGKSVDWGDKFEKLKLSKKNLVTNIEMRQEVVKKDSEDRGAKQRAIDELEKRFESEIKQARELKNQPKEEKKPEPEKVVEPEEEKAESTVVETFIDEEKAEEKSEKPEVVADDTPKAEEKKEQSKAEEKKEAPVVEEKKEKKANGEKKEKKESKKEEEPVINDDVDVIMDTVVETSRNVEKKVDEVHKETSQTIQYIAGMSRAFSDLPKTIGNTVMAQADRVLDGQKKLAAATDRNAKLISEIAETTETFQGQFKKLDQIDTLTQVLSDKGLEIKKTAAPTSREEEDIVNMSKYATAIIDQLTIAACELVKKQAEYDKQDGYKANSEQEMKAQIEEERAVATKKAKLELVSAILNKFTDIEDMMNKENQMLSLVWSALTEQGVEIDGNGSYKKGESVEISAEDAEKMSAKYAGINGAGKYTVTKTGLSFQGETVFKAEFEKQSE